MMYDAYSLDRCDAMEWLAKTYRVLPDVIPAEMNQIDGWCSAPLFKDWRFVVLDNGELVFANFLSPCITKADLEAHNATVLLS